MEQFAGKIWNITCWFLWTHDQRYEPNIKYRTRMTQARATRPKDQGGLGLIDVHLQMIALKTSLFNRIITDNNISMKKTVESLLSNSNFRDLTAGGDVNNVLSPFIESWRKASANALWDQNIQDTNIAKNWNFHKDTSCKQLYGILRRYKYHSTESLTRGQKRWIANGVDIIRCIRNVYQSPADSRVKSTAVMILTRSLPIRNSREDIKDIFFDPPENPIIVENLFTAAKRWFPNLERFPWTLENTFKKIQGSPKFTISTTIISITLWILWKKRNKKLREDTELTITI